VGAIPKLNGTLNPGDQFRITYSAPAGKLFKIEPRASTTDPNGYFLTAEWWSDSAQFASPTAGSSVQFESLSGSTGAPSEFNLDYDTQGRIRGFIAFNASEMSFRSISMLFNLPPSISKTFTNLEPPFMSMFVFAYDESLRTPVASLIDAPTPRSPSPPLSSSFPAASPSSPWPSRGSVGSVASLQPEASKIESCDFSFFCSSPRSSPLKSPNRLSRRRT